MKALFDRLTDAMKGKTVSGLSEDAKDLESMAKFFNMRNAEARARHILVGPLDAASRPTDGMPSRPTKKPPTAKPCPTCEIQAGAEFADLAKFHRQRPPAPAA